MDGELEVRHPKPENWDGERKLLALIETASLNKQEMSEYCRENGLYVEQMERWKEFAIAGTESGTLLTRGQSREWQRDKKKLHRLEKELRRKEKALAEAAALLVLEKKAQALWGEREKK
uniref:Transposase n=1 Tax=Candidatus Kentrum sp. FW TaxID=2126338 RepID=A0A450U209_9GAMM|nr:MAG: hypothetical protein BECKFW1821C_GA0114237_11092 [Candidatus Kentron sp. FW]